MGSKNKVRKTKRRKKQEDYEENLFGSDEIFAFIAGYTSGGAPYGITWEEMEVIEQRENNIFKEEERCRDDKEDDLPFN